MLRHQRDVVAALAVRERLARSRVTVAKARLKRAKARFLANPVNLLLPFTAGALGGAVALHRRPASGRPATSGEARPRRERIEWGVLLKTATTLWGLSLPLREAILDARAAAVADAADRTDDAADRPTRPADEPATPRRRSSAARPPSPTARPSVGPPDGPPA